MRILHVTPHYYPVVGGAETYVKEISERLAQRGHDVTVLAMRSGEVNGASDAEVINQVKVNRFRPAGRVQDVFKLALQMPGAHRLLGPVVGTDRIEMFTASPYGLRPFYFSVRSRPDVVAVINWYGGWLAYQICLAQRLRHFALVGIPLFHTERSWSEAAIHSQLLECCDAVVAMTAHERNFIARRSTQDNAQVVGVGVDPSAFTTAAGDQFRARHGIGEAPLVGYVGRMVPSKGVATLIEAMKRVWRTEPGVRLLLAGSGFPTGPGRQDEISQALAGLSEDERARIIVVDRFSEGEKSSMFAALDVFAMPSVAESFGIAYLEAWVCKKAVIGSRIGSTECVIEDGVDGLLVPPGNSDELAAAIRRLLADRAACDRMGSAGHLKTVTRFTWDKIAEQVEHIYHQAHAASVKH